MIQQLIEEQQQYLNAYFHHFDVQRAQSILDAVFACRGTVILSGVGKSGHIAQKIAATLISTGTKAFFLDPTHAVHGDLGYVSEKDVFIAFSKSGESQELLELVPLIRKRSVYCIAIVSNPKSRLAAMCDEFMNLFVERELCPFDLAPTTSTLTQLLFGDFLAVALMKRKKITMDHFALNHPGGRIGRRISLKVKDLMLQGEALPLCRPSDPLISVLPELSIKRCGCLLVVNESKELQGIFTDGDLRRSLEVAGSPALENPMSRLMNLNPRFISPDQLAWEAMQKMEEDPHRLITVLPVLHQGVLVGLLRLHDVLQAGL